MIEFQDERVQSLEMPDKVWRYRAQIGQDPETPIVCGYDELAGLTRVVWNNGRLQGKYADLECVFRREFNDRIGIGQPPVGAAVCTRGRIDRDSVLAGKRGGARNMIVVFVGQNDRQQRLRWNFENTEPFFDLAHAETAIDHDGLAVLLDDRGVASTAAA